MYTVIELSQIIAPTQHILVRHGKSTLYQGPMRNITSNCSNSHVISIRPAAQKNQRNILILYVGAPIYSFIL